MAPVQRTSLGAIERQRDYCGGGCVVLLKSHEQARDLGEIRRKLSELKSEHERLPQADTKEGIMERAAKLRDIGEKLHWVKMRAVNLHTLSYMQGTLQEIVDEIESHPAYIEYAQHKAWQEWDKLRGPMEELAWIP